MKFKKTLASLVVASAIALGSANTKATLIPFEQVIPDSYSVSGDILNSEKAVDGDFDTFAENSKDKFNFSITETYNNKFNATSLDFTSQFKIGRYSQCSVDYSIDSSDWTNIYENSSLSSSSLDKTLNHTLDMGGANNVRFRSQFNSPFSLSSDTKYNESKTIWIPEVATVGLLGLGSLFLLKKSK